MAAKKLEINTTISFDEICDQAMMAIIIFDKDTQQAIYINQMAQETIELGDLELKDLELKNLFPENTRENARAFDDSFIQDAGFYQDLTIQKINHSHFIANMGIRFINNGKHLMLSFQDVSFQKKLQREVNVKQQELIRSFQEILEQNKELQSLSDAKDKLITLSTHELRTPLSAIIALSETLSMGILEDPKEQQKYTNDIHNEALHLMNILNNMLELLKLRTGKMPLYLEQTEVNEFINESIDKYKKQISRKSIELKIHNILPTLIYADKIALAKVFNHLISNAVKFNKEDGILEITSHADEDYFYVSIKDTGNGISEKYHDKIFEEFTTLGDIDTHSKGAGISLAVSKLNLEAIGGDLYINPKYINGCEFILKLPINKVCNEEMYGESPYANIEF